MSPVLRTWLLWAPRAFGIALALFLGLFALDAFTGPPSWTMAPAFAMHLVPALIVAGAVVAAWRVPLVGTVLFALLAVGYAATAPPRLDWILLISGPLATVALLYAISALAHRRSEMTA